MKLRLVAALAATPWLLLACTRASAAGDAQRGAELYEARCGGCHAVAADRIGPRHAGLIGRRAGSVPGFDYSDALRRAGFAWNAERLEQWLTDPEALVPGQRMGYRLGDARDRADVIAYLATLTAAR
ncbi:MAG TPA: c-type cytochrome [Ideonella sp.]|nr:c-type cytochrome [Ideonella sp.]